LASAGLALVQVLLSPAIIESPVYLVHKSADHEPTLIVEDEAEEELSPEVDAVIGGETTHEPLLSEQAQQKRKAMSIGDILRTSDAKLKRGLAIVVLAMVSQQMSGINAVYYYSTSIMSVVFPSAADLISVFLAFVGFVLTLAPVFLIERMGRRGLFVLSASGITIASLILAFGINIGTTVMPSFGILLHVSAFSLGMGPIPFILIGDVVPSYATGAVGSFALAINWIGNFLVGICFLPLRSYLSGPAGSHDGNVFFIFAGLTFTLTAIIVKLYKS